MVKFLIHRPVAVIMVFVAFLLLGILAVKQIPVSPLPDIDIPEITIHVNYENASAIQLENAVVKRLRSQLVQLANIERIHTKTRDGYAIIRIQFKYGTDVDYSFLEANEKIDLSMSGFPRDMERPRVIKSSVTDIPVFYINLRLKSIDSSTNSSSKFIELSEFTEQVIKRRLEQLPEIAFVDITGTSDPEIFIIPHSAAINALNISEDDFRRIIENNNQIAGNVKAIDGQLEYSIRFATSNAATIDDIKDTRFLLRGRIFKLSDIASIGIRQRHAEGGFFSHGQPAINLAVIKQPDTKMDELRIKVERLIKGLEKTYPDIRFEQTQDQAALLDYSISNLKQDLVAGSLLAFILMFFFLKNLRAPILIGITIPVSLILSILFFKLFGITINIISLSGLVLGVGLMIDNSIIVIDNITQYRERNHDLSDACIKGTTDIIRPLISSVLTTCSVFVPLIFLSGIAGALFYDQAMAITIGLCVSLIVSITLLPTLYRQFHRGKIAPMEINFFDRYGITFFERFYNSGFKWVFQNKLATLCIVFFLILANIFLFIHLKKEKLPVFEETETVAHINWNRNINISENKHRIEKLLSAVNKDIRQWNVMIGRQQYLLNKKEELSLSEAELYVKVKDTKVLGAVKKSMEIFIKQNYQEATLELRPPENIFEKVFGDNEADLVIQVKQEENAEPDHNNTEGLIRQISSRFPDVTVNTIPKQEILELRADPEKLFLYNLSMDRVYNRLRRALNENEISNLARGQQRIPIVMADPQTSLESVLTRTTVLNDRGVAVPVASFLSISKDLSYKHIEGDKNGNYIPLSIETDKPEPIIEYFKTKIKSRNDLDTSYTGSYFSNRQLIKEMALVLAVSVLLLYFILAAQFESLIQPLIVLFELPISMSGALIMLFCFGSSINLISLIGLVVMCGIIINDSILKIDTINELRRSQGYKLMDAIHTGGKRRLKSIIMTSMTTVLSVAPFLFGTDLGSTLQRPLSLALIGGMLIGTPVSLYFIPLVYWFYYRRSEGASLEDQQDKQV